MSNPEIQKPEFYQDPDEEGRMVENPNIQALAQLNSAEINQQIMTARAYPRSVTNFRREMRAMVTYDQPTALSCLYALKRSGKVIEGPSVRFAEAALQAWGNSRAGSRITDIGDEFITAQGFFYDLEKNMAIAFEVMRRITNKDGERYGDDLIGVTGNAACSIAFRNAVLKGIPKTAWNESYQDARNVSIGKGESITVKREEMLKAFAPVGIDKDQIFGLLGVKGIDDVSVDHMILMGGILNSIKEGEVTAEEAFNPKNNLRPGEVAPPRPSRSDFARGTDAKTGEKKPDKAQDHKPAEKKADEQQGQTQAQAQTKDEQKEQVTQAATDAGPAAKDATDEIMAAWYEDQKADLARTEKVRDVTVLRDAVAEQLSGAQLKEWDNLCSDRVKAILDATRKAKK